MVTSSIIKYLLCDKESLTVYRTGKTVSWEDIRRRLFLLDRETNIHIPDHYYKLNKEYSFQGINSVSAILTKGISQIAKDFLELRENRIYVKQHRQTEWQELITYIPPLVLIASLLAASKSIDVYSQESIRDFYEEYILPNSRYTALPSPYLKQMEAYVQENNGFHDLHMHLSGATETDVTWQDFLFAPDKVSEELQKGFDDELVKEQYEQEASGITAVEYGELLKSAQRLRLYLFWHTPSLNGCGKIEQLKDVENLKSLEDLLQEVNSKYPSEILQADYYHPFYSLIHPWQDKADYNRQALLSMECLMYVLLFKKLADCPHPGVASMFHYYLLILGFSNRMLVQQVDQYGFTQFKKITVNELRGHSERVYLNRFFQLQGNELRHIRLLEGRFAPKNTQREVEKLLSSIQSGWEGMKKRISEEWKRSGVSDEGTETGLLPELNLVAHFIKMTEKHIDTYTRHRELRYRVWNQAIVLAYMREKKSEYLRNVVGIDAASSEFDAPPEVFAPAFRMLRRRGFKHFTYHAGEDFYHVISGLRAIYEAVDFHELECGDRIGHATAAGVSVQVWRNNIGDAILMRQGEYLDDLIFVYHLLVTTVKKVPALEILKAKLPFLINRIQELASTIYGSYCSLKGLEDAWLLRKYCAVTLRNVSMRDERGEWDIFKGDIPEDRLKEYGTFDEQEWRDIRKEILNNTHVNDFHKNEAIELWKKYHSADYRKAYDKIVEVEVEDCFTLDEISLLQLAVLHFLHEKEIVIETLPTSNVRIGHHASFQTYHLWNWLQWEKKGHCIPPIVVGTDDVGIFATNIYNEFANIYCFLTHIKKVPHSKAMGVIERLEQNARIYKFG